MASFGEPTESALAPRITHLICLDFEATCGHDDFDRNKQEIIEFPWVTIDLESVSGARLPCQLSLLSKAQLNHLSFMSRFPPQHSLVFGWVKFHDRLLTLGCLHIPFYDRTRSSTNDSFM